MQDNTTPHTAKETISALRGVSGEFNGEDRIISKGLWPTRSPSKPLWFLFVWKTQKCCVCQQSTWPGNSKIKIFVKQFTAFINVSRNLFERIQAYFTAEGRHFEHILWWYNINYYIWLIINKRCKQCVLAVPAARQNFSRQVAKGFRRKLPSVKSRPSQPALWIICIYKTFAHKVPRLI
jgi:hypothetical protein